MGVPSSGPYAMLFDNTCTSTDCLIHAHTHHTRIYGSYRRFASPLALRLSKEQFHGAGRRIATTAQVYKDVRRGRELALFELYPEWHAQMMQLTKTQRQILYAVTLNANASVAEVARMLGFRDHVVRRTIDFFLEAKVFLRRAAWLNPYLLGLEQHVLHVELPLQSLASRKLFLELASSSEEAIAVIELGSDAQFELRLLTRDSMHLSQFLENLSNRFPLPFRILRCLTTIETEYSGSCEPGLPLVSWEPLRFGPISSERVRLQIDEADHKILSGLANEHYLSLKQLAQRIGMPTATLQYRMSRLEAIRLISGHFYVMDPKMFNQTPVVLQIRSQCLKKPQREALKKFAHHHPLITSISFFLGEQTADAYTLVSDFGDVHHVIADFAKEFKNVIDSVRITPQVSFSKYTTYPYVDYETLTGPSHNK